MVTSIAREDALALGPEQSHRIIAVLEEAAEKLGFLGSIMPDVLQHRDELSKFVGDEISRIIQVLPMTSEPGRGAE